MQRRLEAFYALEPGSPVTEFLASDAEAESLPGHGSRTLVAQQGEHELALSVVLESSVRHELHDADPRARLDEGNLAALCVLTEEVSHFLYLLFCARCSRSVTQLELELQGELDKYLTSAYFLSLQNEGAVAGRLRELLFKSWRLADHVEPDAAERYRVASELAWRYSGWLEARYLGRGRLPELRREARRFYRLGRAEKLERIARL